MSLSTPIAAVTCTMEERADVTRTPILSALPVATALTLAVIASGCAAHDMEEPDLLPHTGSVLAEQLGEVPEHQEGSAAIGSRTAPESNADLATNSAPAEPAETVGAAGLALQVDAVYLHRTYNEVTGEHFYTANTNEADAAGFDFEVLGYFGLERQPREGFVPFYRCYWRPAGKHFYSRGVSCEGADANNEGIIGHIGATPRAGTIPLLRLYNPQNNDHLYTTDLDEPVLAVLNYGYQFEGIAGYVYPKQ